LGVFEFFKKIIGYFDQENIPYMLSGSIAMGLYVTPRATRNVDFVVKLLPEHVDGFVSYFQGEYYCSEIAVLDAIQHHSMFNVIDHSSGYKADFVILKNQEYRLTEFQRRKQTLFFDVDVFVVSVEDLLISKLAWIQEWQNAIQIGDIKSLLNFQGLQMDYVKYWVERLNLNTFELL
jgi:hypothetical protein